MELSDKGTVGVQQLNNGVYSSRDGSGRLWHCQFRLGEAPGVENSVTKVQWGYNN